MPSQQLVPSHRLSGAPQSPSNSILGRQHLHCVFLGLGCEEELLLSILLYGMECPSGQLGAAAQLHPQVAEEGKSLALGRHCSATAKTLVGYQHHFSHKFKTLRHLDHYKEN